MDRLILDIKALVLLSDNTESLSNTIREKIIGSHDEHISKFVSVLQPYTKSQSKLGSFLVALGELALAAFLSIVGLSLMAPSLMGFQTPSQLLAYFRDLLSSVSSGTLSNPLIPFLDFVFALVLLLGAFYMLRRASIDLKEANLSSEQRG